MSETKTPEPLMRVENLTMHFPIQRGFLQRTVGTIKAVSEVSFSVYPGETLGLVGESGCGKTTTGRAILQLYRPTGGQVYFEGHDLVAMSDEAVRQTRRRMQMIFQDPYASLNPRMTVGDIIGESLRVHGLASGRARTEKVAEMLHTVGMNPSHMRRYPHEFSGGQRQRVGIARALVVEPSFVVCDEPISALDVSIQAQIVNLLRKLQRQFGLTYLFIAHDLSMVRQISNRVAVMYLGQIVELAGRTALYEEPLHPYSVSLLSAVPVPDPKVEVRRRRIVLKGDLPSPANPPTGCPFSTRCPLALDRCRQERPAFLEMRPGHHVACHRVDEAGPGTGLPPIAPE